MSVQDNGAWVQYLASSAQTNFLVPFEFPTIDDLFVYLTPVGQDPDPDTDKLTYPTDYTVTGVGEEEGGEIILTTPATLNDVITIERDVAFERLSDYKIDGVFSALGLNQNFDRDMLLLQQNESLIRKRGLLYPVTSKLDKGQTTLPRLEPGQHWRANGSGNLVGAEFTESPDWSTLRSEIESRSSSAPGTDVVGAYKTELGGAQSLTDYLASLYTQSYETVPEEVQKATWISSSVTGTNDYVGTTTPAFTPAVGSVVWISIANTNTAASTLAINGETPVAIVSFNGGALAGGELKASRTYLMRRGSSDWTIKANYETASKTQMEAADNNNFVATPGNMIDHPGVAKAWVSWNQTNDTTVVVNDSYNITSVLPQGGSATGHVVVTFSITMANINYIITGTGGSKAAVAESFVSPVYNTFTTTSVEIKTHKADGSLDNVDRNSIAIFGKIATP